MSTLAFEVKASYAFIERNFFIVRRYWAWELVWLVYSIVNSLSVSYIGFGMEKLGGQGIDSHFLVVYLAIGTLVWRYLSSVFYWVTDVVGMERWEGTIEYTLMAPIRRVTHMLGQTAFAVVYSLFHTAVILGATLLFFDIRLANANLAGAAVMLMAGSLSFIGISIVGAVLPLLFPERGSQMTHVIIALLLLVSGVYYPVDVLPAWLQVASKFSPATYVLDGVRATLLDGAVTGSLWPYIWPLLVIGLLTIPAGLRIFRWAEHYAKRTGKLHRNG
ncbi:ABC transporter permease [Candidatus Amarolinea dominans]|uniref:ABC transporter permease n=1 Tax=Candidatus Amarolinea dominans TaxID=3140696 RepID=UPI001D429C5D|nr:ABC transporter permease [Anaerolineae bacterium]